MKQSSTITIAAPAKVVFDILADPRKHSLIDGSGSLAALAVGPNRLSLGAKFGMDMTRGPDMQNTVVEFEEDQLIAWRHKAPHRWRYELNELPEGVQVTETWDASYHVAPARLIIKLLGFPKRNQKGIEETLKQLKKIAEADAAA